MNGTTFSNQNRPHGSPSSSFSWRRRIYLLSTLVILGGGIYLLLSDATGLEYYKHVDEVVQNPNAWQGKSLQIHGFVVPGSIQSEFQKEQNQHTYRFQVENCGKIMTAEYQGIVPDTFRDGAEVVLKGSLQTSIAVQASSASSVPVPPSVPSTFFHIRVKEVLGKCPSKYSQDIKHLKEQAERCIRETKETT